jgi:hypothetical protein
MTVVAGEPDYGIQATTPLEVLDPSGIKSALIIKSTDPFKVAMEFNILSGLVPLGPHLSYEVKYFAESIGPGPEYDLGAVGKPTKAGQVTYNATTPVGSETVRDIPAGTLADGVYNLGAIVSFKQDGATPTPYPMTVYVAGPAIQVYT